LRVSSDIGHHCALLEGGLVHCWNYTVARISNLVPYWDNPKDYFKGLRGVIDVATGALGSAALHDDRNPVDRWGWRAGVHTMTLPDEYRTDRLVMTGARIGMTSPNSQATSTHWSTWSYADTTDWTLKHDAFPLSVQESMPITIQQIGNPYYHCLRFSD